MAQELDKGAVQNLDTNGDGLDKGAVQHTPVVAAAGGPKGPFGHPFTGAFGGPF